MNLAGRIERAVMENYFWHTVSVFMAFLAVMNPVALTPIFVSLTSDYDAATKRSIARNAVLLSLVFVVILCLAGRWVFVTFGITLTAIRITGGLVLFLIGLEMSQGKPSSLHHPSGEDQRGSPESGLSLALSPLMMPILAGPGTIATALNFSATGDLFHLSTTVGAFLVLCVITFLFFVSGDRVVRRLGRSAIDALTRLMGLVLAVIGTQMVIDGILEVIARSN